MERGRSTRRWRRRRGGRARSLIMRGSMECSACGYPLGAATSTCPGCGASADPATETMPAVALPDAPGMAAAPAAPAPPDVTLAPPLGPADAALRPPPPAYPHAPWPRPSGDGSRGRAVGAAIGVAVALLLLGGLIVGGSDLFGMRDPGRPLVPGGSGVGDATAAGDGGFNCAPQQLAAPASGSWTLFRASFGTRPRFDYLTLHLRRSGQSDETATIHAELLLSAEVAQRYGAHAPASSRALVVALDGPVTIAGPFGARPGHRALREFEIVRDADRVLVVAAVEGSGCFTISGQEWEDDDGDDPAQLTLEIERP
jgi:hypothetical protein